MKVLVALLTISFGVGQNLRSSTSERRNILWSFPSFKSIPTSASAPPEEIVLLDSSTPVKGESIGWDKEPVQEVNEVEHVNINAAKESEDMVADKIQIVEKEVEAVSEENEAVVVEAGVVTEGTDEVAEMSDVVAAEAEAVIEEGEASAEGAEVTTEEVEASTEEAEVTTIEESETVTAAGEAIEEVEFETKEAEEVIKESETESEAVTEDASNGIKGPETNTDASSVEESGVFQAEVMEEPVYGKVVAPADAVAGMIVRVEAPDGRVMQVKLPQGVQPGQVFAVQFPSLNPTPAAVESDAVGSTETVEKEGEVDEPVEKEVEVDEPVEKEVEVDEPVEKRGEVDDVEKEGEVGDVEATKEVETISGTSLMQPNKKENEDPQGPVIAKLLKVFRLVGELQEIFESLDLNHDKVIDEGELTASGSVSAMEEMLQGVIG